MGLSNPYMEVGVLEVYRRKPEVLVKQGQNGSQGYHAKTSVLQKGIKSP